MCGIVEHKWPPAHVWVTSCLPAHYLVDQSSGLVAVINAKCLVHAWYESCDLNGAWQLTPILVILLIHFFKAPALPSVMFKLRNRSKFTSLTFKNYTCFASLSKISFTYAQRISCTISFRASRLCILIVIFQQILKIFHTTIDDRVFQYLNIFFRNTNIDDISTCCDHHLFSVTLSPRESFMWSQIYDKLSFMRFYQTYNRISSQFLIMHRISYCYRTDTISY